jgi:hypothetical protein
MQAVIGQTQTGEMKKGQTTKRFYFPRRERDPNAMDVDALTLHKWLALLLTMNRHC